jgi:hypothetical protein
MIRQKEYLSWSQYSLWTKSKREYWKRYGLGEDRSQNKFFEKGRELANALEYDDDGSFSSDELLSVVLENVPKLHYMEHKVEVELSNGEKLLSYLDSCDFVGWEFYEYKTGKEPWTQERVLAHEQLLFYALSLFIKSGRTTIPTCKLFWIETEQTEEGLKYTGLVESFERNFSELEIETFEATLIKAIDDIEAFEYLELDLEDEVVDRYIFLQNSIKEMEDEIELIRLKIKIEMETEEVQYASAKNGKFMISESKKWTYSADLVDVATKFAKQIKIAQAQEQKDGSATCGVTKSLKFSINKV